MTTASEKIHHPHATQVTPAHKTHRYVNMNEVPVGVVSSEGRKFYVAPFSDVGTTHEDPVALYVVEGAYYADQVRPYGSLSVHPDDDHHRRAVDAAHRIDAINEQRGLAGLELLDVTGHAPEATTAADAHAAGIPTETDRVELLPAGTPSGEVTDPVNDIPPQTGGGLAATGAAVVAGEGELIDVTGTGKTDIADVKPELSHAEVVAVTSVADDAPVVRTQVVHHKPVTSAHAKPHGKPHGKK